MQIENIALLELFMQTICDASDEKSQLSELPAATKITTLAKQLGNKKCIMENLALQYENRGEIKLASATRHLLTALEDKNLLSSTKPETHTRRLDYVYPIV